MENLQPVQLQQVEQVNLSSIQKICNECAVYLQSNLLMSPDFLVNYTEQVIQKLEEYRPVAIELAQRGFPNLLAQLNTCLTDGVTARDIYKKMVMDNNTTQEKISNNKLDTSRFTSDIVQQVISNQNNALDNIFSKYMNH